MNQSLWFLSCAVVGNQIKILIHGSLASVQHLFFTNEHFLETFAVGKLTSMQFWRKCITFLHLKSTKFVFQEEI